tara:strand:- start:222 stop:1181 length:960 start_codon:yes stop_codon:yes gene_type:complete
MKKLFSLITVTFLLASIQSCSKDEDVQNEPMSIFDVISVSTNYTYLTYALQKTDLAIVLNGVDKYTLYAPSDMVFRQFLMTNGFSTVDDVPTALLKQILLNHVMAGEVEYQDFKTGYYETAALSELSNSPISMHVKQINMSVTLNGKTRITNGNYRTTNGIIHTVNSVIPLPNLVTFVTADPNFEYLAAALTRNDLELDFVSILSSNPGANSAPFTVFAPTDQAFKDVLTELDVQQLSDIDEPTLRSTLTYHVIGDTNAMSTDLSDNLQLNTLGGPITANITGGASITDGNNRISKIIAVDVQTTNGVIHVIDKVILPN